MENICTYLEWDSLFFHRRIARIEPDRLDDDLMTDILCWCAKNRIDCAYYLCSSGHAQTLRLVEKNGFNLVDLRLFFECQLPPPECHDSTGWQPYPIHRAETADHDDLVAIAGISYLASRFYFDDHFPHEQSRRLFETWIEKSIDGYADAVLVATDRGLTAGYITCRLGEQSRGIIELLGVAPEFRGRGVGSCLIDAAFDWFAEHEVTLVEVVTQGRNLPAIRLYERKGFLQRSIDLRYHRWFL